MKIVRKEKLPMKLSIIIVAYKSPQILKRCLASLFSVNDLGEDVEVIVVDNSPADERVDAVVAGFDFPNLHYIPDDNRGFGAGNNTGARAATGEIIAFINPDIIFIEPVFRSVVDRFEQDPALNLLGIKLLQENLKTGFSFFWDYKTGILSKYTQKLWNKLDRFDPNKMYIAGADLWFRHSAFQAIGGFDENIFMYYEEPDLTRRLKKAYPNGRIAYEKDLKMIHLEKQSTPATPAQLGREVDACIYCGKKHGLDYRKKVRFEYNYLKLKAAIFKIIAKGKAGSIQESLAYLDQHYGF